MLVLMLWEAWQMDYGPKPQIAATQQQGNTKEELPVSVAGEAAKGVTQTESSVPVIEAYASHIITVKTDVFNLEIDTQGGTLRNLDLLHYPVEKEAPDVVKSVNNFLCRAIKLRCKEKTAKDVVVRLFNSDVEQLFLAQSGLMTNSGSTAAPNHQTALNALQDRHELPADQNSLKVPLTWSDGQGLQYTKTYTFTRGSYVVNVEQKLVNNSDKPWSGRQYSQLLRRPYTDPNANTFIRTYAGGVVYDEAEKYQKIDFDDMEEGNLDRTAKGGWSAMIQHYFASAFIPPQEQENHFYTKKLPEQRYAIGSYSAPVEVQAHGEAVMTAQLFAGPKIQPMMEAVAPGLELTVDYGWLTFVGKPIYWLLNKIHSLVNNWGFAILGVTLCIKLLFFKLSEASYRSMAKMRKLQPRLQQLKEHYADDRQRFNQEMMSLYKQEKVNPMGGCLPVLVQIPVFICLYWVLIETVELRQAPFALWLQDLTSEDPFYILPLVMGVTMWIQQQLNPTSVDPIQAKVMKMFPVMFTVFFLFFPSGLVLYWVFNNSLSIVQQWYITKGIEGHDK
jgi:YidC/Oxa1 family membrane protein insertase